MGKSYPSAEMQSMYSAAPADRANTELVLIFLFVCLSLSIYIMIHKQFSLYYDSSVCLETRGASSWDRNLTDFTFVGYLTSNYRPSQLKRRNFFTYIFIYIYGYRLPKCSIYENSFVFTRMW